MNQSEDDYAALHSYIQLVEMEIDQVINGAMPRAGSVLTDAPPSVNITRPPSLALQKTPERKSEGQASKPPKGSNRETRLSKKGADDSGNGDTGLSLRKANRRKVLEKGNTAKQGFARRELLSPSLREDLRKSSSDDVAELENLYVVEDVEGKDDELLQNILFSKEKSELLESSGQEEDNFLWDESLRPVPLRAKIKPQQTDLQKLLDTDRDSLILGPGVRVREEDCHHCTDGMSRCSLTIRHCHHHENRHQHYHRHHRCVSEPDDCPVLQLDHMVAWRQSFQPCHCHHRYLPPERGCHYCSASDNDRLFGLPQRKSSDPLDRFHSAKCSSEDVHVRKMYGSLNGECCLTERGHAWDRHRRKTYNDSDELRTAISCNALDKPHRRKFSGPLDYYDTRNYSHLLEERCLVGSVDPFEEHNRENSSEILPKIRSSPLQLNRTPYRCQSHHTQPKHFVELAPKAPLCSPILTDAISSPSSDLEIFEEDKSEDVSTSDRSYTDSELRDIFNCPENKPSHRDDSKHKLSRKSYPNDALIISPPPGFGSPDSEEERWVKVRLVTRSQDDLTCRSDKRRMAETDNSSVASEFQYYPTPLDFNANQQVSKRDTSRPSDVYTPCDSSLDKGQRTADDKGQRTADDKGQRTADDKGQRSADDKGQRTAEDKGQRTADDKRKSSSDHQRSASSPAKSGTWIISSETPGSERSQIKEQSSLPDHRLVSQDAGELNSRTSKTLPAPDVEVTSSDLNFEESSLSILTDILRPDSADSSPCPSHSYVIPSYSISEEDSANCERRNSAARRQDIQSKCIVNDLSVSKQDRIHIESVVTPESLGNSVSSDLLPYHSDTVSAVIPDSLDSSINSELSEENTDTGDLAISDSLDSSVNSELSQDYVDIGALVTPDSLESSINSDLLPTLEDDQNNNTSRNLLSMCLASDCKLSKSCRSQRIAQPQEKLHIGSQTTEKRHDGAVNTNVLTLEASKSCQNNCTQDFSKHITERSDNSTVSSRRTDKPTDSKFLPETSFSTGRADKKDVEMKHTNIEKHCRDTDTKEIVCLDDKKAQRNTSVINSVGVSDDCTLKKVELKDTGVQTSLELDILVADNAETLKIHRGDIKETNEGMDKSLDDFKRGYGIGTGSLHNEVQHADSNKTCDRDKHLHCKNEHFDNSIIIHDELNTKTMCDTKNEAATRAAGARTPIRASLLRSKSVHESHHIDGDTKGNKREDRPDASGLSGNLRELSHLNIDVSQRLIGGEQRFVVTSGCSELQVVVNALTPVLSRRSRAKNTRRLHNLDSVTEMPNSVKSTTDSLPVNAAVKSCDDNFAVDVNFRSDSSENSTNYQNKYHASKAIPVYARLRSYEGSNADNIEKNISNRQEDLKGKHVDYLKEPKPNRISRSASARASGATRNITTPKYSQVNGKDEFLEELELGKNSLFISPKLSHTWHGSSTSPAHLPSPRMGVGEKFGVKYARGVDGSIRPIVLAPSSPVSTPEADQHAHTMPVISRTLLDALHKRYCAYQYSNHYQTIQQFSLLKLDSTITSGNQAVTALLAEPLHARGHEVQAAPPSPEIMARLRMLKNSVDLNTNKSCRQTSGHPADKEQPVPFSQPPALKEFLLEENSMEFARPSEDIQAENIWYLTPDSSPDLQDKLNHGGKHHTELEAAEALKWLRAAGFPQYAQMFDDGQFPVDMGVVERDHDFLDKDSLQSLFRRLETLNRYAGIKRDSHPCKKTASEEEDEDDFCALSERWEYQKSARRWSRKDLSSSPKTTLSLKDQDLADRSGSHDSLLADQDSGSQIGDSPLPKSKTFHQNVAHSSGSSDMVSVSHGGLAVADISPENSSKTGAPVSPRLRRAASDKMKTAKGLFKKMEGMKSTKSRRQSSHRNIVEISGPVVADRENMQAKLDKLNCVDILLDADTQLSPPLVRGSLSERGQGLPSATKSRNLSSSIHAGQPSPQSPHSPPSPRPYSDFLLRSREEKSLVPSLSAVDARPGIASSNQRPALVHDSSFEEYYQAQTAFLHNLQSSSRGTADSVRKNNSETNLMEIFLVPQDHQPGRFPRVLQNGYIETEACGTAVNVRTGSVRLGRNSCMKSDHASASLRPTQRSEIKNISNRLSVYDNCSPSESKRSENSSLLPSAAEVESSGESKPPTGNIQQENTQLPKHGFIQEVNSDSSRQESRDTSRESSVVRTRESSVVRTRWNFSDQHVPNSDHERSVSFESSTSSQSPDDNTLVNVDELDSDAKSSQISSSNSVSLKLKVTHSSSLDSYFKDGSGQIERAATDSSKMPPAGTFQENYDEFDRILQELYKNINDLTTFMDKDKSEKTPRLVRAATSPLPAGNSHPHTPLHVATLPARPVLKPQQPVPESSSPSSATSDLVPSPASPRSPQDSSEPLDFYGVLELDQENSSSGGDGSNTGESGSEDQEMGLTDVSQDDSLDQIIEVFRERRDSGVGHSLTRAPSDRRRKKIRWHSFQKSHRPDINSRAMQINSLTVGQLVRLQKLSLLRLTGIMEKCLPVNKSGWNWMVPRFMKRQKVPDFNDKNVFGVPLSVMAQRTGQPLPQCVLYAMRYLRRTCPSAVGLFRKSGVKSKIQQLRDYLEAHPDTTNFDGENAYNVADMLKTYFRDLPECLLTNKMSETFRSIYTYVPPSQRLDAIQAAILLLPDENREVLQSILLFLSDISEHEADHQMNASNLAVCFTPTVFHLGPRQSLPYSPKRNRKNSSGIPDPREIMEQKAAHECLLMMITECKKLFTVPSNLFRQLQVQSVAHVEPSLPQDIGSCPSDVRAFGQERIQMVLKESHDKNRGWVPTVTVGDVEVFHRKPLDDCLLKEWKLVVDIEAPPVEVLRRIMHERHTWDEDLLSWSVVERLDPHSDIFQYVLNSMAPHPPRNFCSLRYWRSDLNKGACALITKSVEHSDALEIHGVWAVDLGTYYLMEPCGSGRSRLTYITRVDTRGRMPEWYTKIFGHICANFLDRLKESFKQDAEGPETKV